MGDRANADGAPASQGAPAARYTPAPAPARRTPVLLGWLLAGAMAIGVSSAAVLVMGSRPALAETAAQVETPVPLPPLGAVSDQTSVSGISSGAYMAGQFQIAHSSLVVGAAIIAGGPYGCAESLFTDWMWGPSAAFFNMSKAVNGCMLAGMQMWGVPDVASLVKRTQRLAEEGRIDELSGLRQDKLYLFSGRNDYTVVPLIVARAAEYYRDIGVPIANMKIVADLPAGHAFITERDGNLCELTGAPYVAHCNYDQAGELLAHIYGALAPRVAEPAGSFIVYDQKSFAGTDDPDHGMSDRGVVYVPPSCRDKAGCRVHIAFHGCGQNRAYVGDAFIRESGFARWADANRLIVLFPQIMATAINPQGCWDWWGYTGRDYLTRNAPQIAMVHRMLQRLAAARP